MGKFNFHTHSHYCDGSDHPEKYIESAIAAGFHSLGFSSHAPVPFSNSFAIKSKEKLIEYCHTIRGLSEKYKGTIKVFLSLEIDFIPGLMPEFSELSNGCRLDYVIGSVHLVRKMGTEKLWFIDGPKAEIYDQGLKESFNGDIKQAVTAYYHQINLMVETQRPDIVGHLDKVKMHNKGRYFSEDDKWYNDLVDETLAVVKENGSIIEVNTRGIYKKRSESLFPGVKVLKKIKSSGIPVTLSSDSHKPHEIDGYYPEARKILKEIGFEKLMIFDGDRWIPENI
jgi:histidinol-phosphatase (PHP family)